MQSSSEQPLVGEEHCVTTLITAAKETTHSLASNSLTPYPRAHMYHSLSILLNVYFNTFYYILIFIENFKNNTLCFGHFFVNLIDILSL